MTFDYDDGGWTGFLREIHSSESTIAKDVLGVVFGEYMGQGAARTVFRCRFDRSLVIKVETGGFWFQNVHEHQIWQDAQGTEAERWLAPVVDVSAKGTVLLQKRCEPIPESRLPEKIPAWLTDTKADNWGLFENRPVCHDYGVSLALNRSLSSKAMRKADWWT